MVKISKTKAVTAYKVFNSDWKCKSFQFEVGKTYKHNGTVRICQSGFHACISVNHCFSYYSFDSSNKVAEVLIWGEIDSHEEDTKVCGSNISIVRELTWGEVLILANIGKDNTGHSNSGDRNSGYRNSGDSNSGYRNSGYRNSGNWNSGYRNSGYSNSGYSNSGNWNSGNWNSGNRNSGDSNSGYRNSGAFCSDTNAEVHLFDKPSGIKMQDWERHKAVQIMNRNLETHIWVYANSMTDQEKAYYPGWEARDGYLKHIPLKEAWKNMWPNLDDESRQIFLTLPNFDAKKFAEITGITV